MTKSLGALRSTFTIHNKKDSILRAPGMMLREADTIDGSVTVAYMICHDEANK